MNRDELLIAVFEHSEDAILVTDLNDIIQTWNPAAERLYGYREEEVVGRSAILLLPSERTDEETTILDRIRTGERVDHFETLRLRKDGTSITVSLTISPVRSGGQIVAASHIARRITERAAMEAATAQLAAIVDFSEDAIISKNLDGIVLTWNKGAERIYGYSNDDIRWRPISILLPADRQDEEATILERLKNGERVDHFETVRVRKGGTSIDVSLTISPILDHDGRIIGASHIAKDISERKTFQTQFFQTQKLESIGVLASGIAHDFNNLLSSVTLGISFAKASLPADHSACSSLAVAEDASAKAAELTHQLLAYAGQGRFVVTQLDLSVLVRDLLKLLQASIPKSVALQVALEPDLPWIEADASQIQQVVMNLVINGAESICPEGGSVQVSTGVTFAEKGPEGATGIEVWMEVRDSGSGMTEATKARIFEPFFTTKFLGRGLGLAAVSGIVRGHAGRMQVESSVGKGSTFRMYFPGVEKLLTKETKPIVRSEELDQNVSGTVLVVDDDPALRKLARMILEHGGYKVLVAEDGRKAVDLFRQHADAINAILLDMTMPIMGGAEAFQLIRAIRGDVPIILSTGYGEEATLKLFSIGTVVGFIKKPYTAAQLFESIRTTSQAMGAVNPLGN
jgi:two-component system cell cycle sensor histidine kinase/response regulator CckA